MWPRSKRVPVMLHAGLARHALRLYEMLLRWHSMHGMHAACSMHGVAACGCLPAADGT